MCGLFGIIHFSEDRLIQARNALDTIMHRGRDQWGEWFKDDVYLGHRRLSIRDLSENGRQPFWDKNGEVVVIVNGEIYNDKELRNLLGEGLFSSQSDSEVVLHGYMVWGIRGVLERLDGFFSFAIYDRRIKKLFLAKDRWGEKPLFYAKTNHQFVFSSEVKAILEFCDELRIFDNEGIKRWIVYRGSREKSTIYHDIFRVSPACFLTIDDDLNISEEKYYDQIEDYLEKQADCRQYSTEEIQETTETLLRDAITKRLVSDVPVGLQLSGGVDSSLIAALLHGQHNEPMHTFSVVFSEPEYQGYSEEIFSSRVANQYGYIHHSFGITKEMVARSYADVVYMFDGMLDYPNAIPLFLLNKMSKEYITVSLTGEGADELFGGYRKYQQVHRIKNHLSYGKLFPDFAFDLPFSRSIQTHILRPAYLNKQYKHNFPKFVDRFNSYVMPDTVEYLFGDFSASLLRNDELAMVNTLPLENRVLLVDHLTYLYNLMDRQDRTSMGAGIESRLPFLDRRLVEWVMKLPVSSLYNNKLTKIPLKQLASKYFDQEFAYRPKKGFPLPLSKWMNDENGFKPYEKKIYDKDFILYEKLDRKKLNTWLECKEFDRKLINYNDSERIWVKWFLMTLRLAQDTFKIRDIK